MSAKQVESVVASGSEVFISLNKLKKSPNNARKTPHSEASIEAYAASMGPADGSAEVAGTSAFGAASGLVSVDEVDSPAPDFSTFWMSH